MINIVIAVATDRHFANTNIDANNQWEFNNFKGKNFNQNVGPYDFCKAENAG